MTVESAARPSWTRSPSSGCEAKSTKAVATLSAGERRLVEMARAVVGSPRLVLLDEPAAGLPDDETEHLAAGHQAHPERDGCAW